MTDRREFLARLAAVAGVPFISDAHAEVDARTELAQLAQGRIGQWQGGVYLLPATSETVQWGWFDNAETPRARVPSGATIVMETMMASMNQILPGTSVEQITQLRVDHPGRGPHSITGPVYVEGAAPGDTLAVRIDRIVPRSYGANWNLPGHLKLGEFPDVFGDPQVKWFFFDSRRGTTEFAPGIHVPVRPFPGIVGVARAESGRVSTVPPGPFGGNLDIRELVEGTTLHLPVFVDGALLWSGDSHAAQGNGEINLTAIETAFNELKLGVTVLKGRKPLAWPRVETPTHWLATGYDRDLGRALAIARDEAEKLAVEVFGLKPADARGFVARSADFRVAEVVNQVKGIYALLPKDRKARPAPRPVTETATRFVTAAADPDPMQAMNRAALALIDRVAEAKRLTRLDAYALASLAMDTRVGATVDGTTTVHCVLDKGLWTRP
ncbi:MAG: acetamidase/formamidase family protein [Burkholderiales bacterium]|nr:acetamidase/formamidase family protein [Burkholderiales bacterium]